MIEIVLGAILILVTAYLAEEQATPQRKKLVWALFVVLVIAQAAIQVRSHSKADAVEQTSTTNQQELKDKLQQSLLTQQYEKGQLDSLVLMIGHLGQSDGTLASAIKQAAQSIKQTLDDPKRNAQASPPKTPAPELTDNQKLHVKANDLILRLQEQARLLHQSYDALGLNASAVQRIRQLAEVKNTFNSNNRELLAEANYFDAVILVALNKQGIFLGRQGRKAAEFELDANADPRSFDVYIGLLENKISSLPDK